MPSLHIVYDPKDRINHPNEVTKTLGLKVAVVPLPEDIEPAKMRETVETLATLVLEAIYGPDDERDADRASEAGRTGGA